MGIKRYGAVITFECDECGDTLETRENDFKTAVREAKDEGWRMFQDDDGWSHHCPDCL